MRLASERITVKTFLSLAEKEISSSSEPRVIVSETALRVLLIRRKISAPAATPETARDSEPFSTPARPSWRRTKAPSPSVNSPPFPSRSTATVTSDAARTNTPSDFSKKKFPLSPASSPASVMPNKVREPSRTETRTNGPAGRSRSTLCPSRFAMRFTAVKRVFNSTLIILEETEIPGILKTAEPTVRTPSEPSTSAIRSPLAPETFTRVEPLAVRKRLAEITSMESPPSARVSKENPPLSACSPTINWAFIPITFTTGPARI